MQVINFSLGASGIEQPIIRKGFKRHSCDQNFRKTLTRVNKKKINNPFTLVNNSIQEIDLNNLTEPSRRSRISIVELHWQKTMTLNHMSSLGDSVELPPVVKAFPPSNKRFSNIKYIELKDIV